MFSSLSLSNFLISSSSSSNQLFESPFFFPNRCDQPPPEEQLKAPLHCEMFPATCLAMFWRHCGGTSCTKQFQSVTFPATAKIVARQVARKVGLNSTFGHGSYNLSRNNFGLCKVCYTEIFFMQLVARTLREKLHGTFHSVTALLKSSQFETALWQSHSKSIQVFLFFRCYCYN